MMFKISTHHHGSCIMNSRRYPTTSNTGAQTQKSTFYFNGIACAATLHLPADSREAPRASILMVHGWGGVQLALTSSFINRFVAAGFAVMEFDYPGWGASAGWPRQDINPWTRVKVANAALAHLKSQPMVDPYKVALWGTSFGGGHVVDLAAEHPELLGALVQVPMLDGLAAVRAVPFFRLLKFCVYALADLLKPGAPIHIPTLADPGKFGTMDRDRAWDALQIGTAAAGIRYDNRVTARSLLTMGPYRPWKRLAKVGVPMLIIGATRDTVAPFVAAKIKQVGNQALQVVEVDADHFDPYFEPFFPDVVGRQLAFLESLLGAKRENMAVHASG